MYRTKSYVAAAAMLLLASVASWADVTDELLSLSLEDLLNTEVESVSKRGQKLMTTPASVYVMDAEEIRLTGATRLQDLLNEIPGVYVGDISYDQPSMTIRDLAIPFTGTVLILLDRVPIQSQNTSGFRFAGFDIDVSEIEKIEVIKGPGATVYGTNAATGVISIFTKQADIQTSTTQLSAGTNSYLAPSVASGRKLSATQSLRGWFKYKTHGGYSNSGFDGPEVLAYSQELGKSVPISNRFDFGNADLRSRSLGISHLANVSSAVQISSRFFYTASKGEEVGIFPEEYPETPGAPTPERVFGFDSRRDLWIASTRLTKSGSKNDLIAALSYRYERVDQAILGGSFDRSDVLDLEIQDRLQWGERHLVDLGGNVRYVAAEIVPLFEQSSISTTEPNYQDWLYSAFLQDQIVFREDLTVTAGLKAEVWTLVSQTPQLMPSLKASYHPTSDFALWGGLSRATTSPGYLDASVEIRTTQIPPAWVYLSAGVPADQIPVGAGKWATVVPGADLKPTEYWTSELGARFAASDSWQFDTATFISTITGRSQFQNANVNEVIPSATREGEEVVPIFYANSVDLLSYGGEAVVRYQPNWRRKIEASYSFLGVDTRNLDPTSTANAQAKAPKHSIRLKARQRFDRGVTLNATASWTSKGAGLVAGFNYVDQVLAGADEGGVVLDDRSTYWVLNLLLQKDFRGGVSLRAWGKNLLTDPYVANFPDFTLLLYPRTVERTFGLALSLDR